MSAESLAIAVLTVSDTRTPENDTSGDLLCASLAEAGHRLAGRAIETDDIYRIRARVSAWIADPGVDAVLTTGGTGFTGRDRTPEALEPLFDKDHRRLRGALSADFSRRDRQFDDPVPRRRGASPTAR